MRVTIVAPRKDLADEHRNAIQAFQRQHLGDIPYITGTYDHVGDPDLWSMSTAMNVGARQATTPGLLLTPSDYVIRPQDVAGAMRALDVYPWVGVFANTFVLTPERTAQALREGALRGAVEGRLLTVCMPCVAVRADVFADIGGMEPRFAGWGPEDLVLRHKLTVLYGSPPPPVSGVVVEMAAPGTGQWVGCDYTGPTPNRAANEALAARYRDASDAGSVRALINETEETRCASW
jgi:hypothetical protein